jgi:hypothetical protein
MPFDPVKDRNIIKHSTNVDIQSKTLVRKLWTGLWNELILPLIKSAI